MEKLSQQQKEVRKEWLLKRIEETEAKLMHYKNLLAELTEE